MSQPIAKTIHDTNATRPSETFGICHWTVDIDGGLLLVVGTTEIRVPMDNVVDLQKFLKKYWL